MKIYGLQAIGESANGWVFKAICKEMFTRLELAVKHKEVFAARCCDPNHLDYVDRRESLKITTTEHELVSGEAGMLS